MAYTEILTSHGLTETKWDNDIWKEYLGMTYWQPVMGTSTDAVIQVKEDLTKQKGDTIRFGMRGEVVGGLVTGNAKGKDNAGSLDFYYDSVTVDNIRHLVRIDDLPMSRQRVGFDLLSAVKEALQSKAKYKLDDDITGYLTDTASRVRGRYLYGALDSNWNATHATALTNLNTTTDILTTKILSIAKRKALIPVNATQRIRPMRVKMGERYEEWFAFYGHTYPIRDLVTFDAAWKNAQLNIPPQSNANSPLFTGSSFKGSWDGVLIYEHARLPLATNTNQNAHNLLLGAQAAVVGWAQRTKFAEEFEDVGHDVIYELHEIRGGTKTVFDIATPEDHGIIHVFTPAVAD